METSRKRMGHPQGGESTEDQADDTGDRPRPRILPPGGLLGCLLMVFASLALSVLCTVAFNLVLH